MIISTIALFLRTKPSEQWLWYGMAAVAVSSGLYAMYESWQMIIPLFSFLFGMTGAFMSGTRGVLVTLPLLMFFFWFFSRRRGLKQTYQIAILLVLTATIITAACLFLKFTMVQRAKSTSSDIITLLHGERIKTNDEVELRILMAEAVWKIFREHPVIGAGEGSYQKEVTALIASDPQFKPIIRFENPENEFLHALISRGPMGLISLLFLFLVSAWIFHRAAVADSPRLSRLGGAGLVVILSYFIFCLTKSALNVSVPLNFFIFALSVIVFQISDQTVDAVADQYTTQSRASKLAAQSSIFDSDSK